MRSLIHYKDFGNISLNIGELMDSRGISVSKIVKITGMHHNVVQRYYDNSANRYDAEVLAKFCYVLECDIVDIFSYTLPVENNGMR